jgi:PAS domain S-box-containing protein
MNKNSKNVARYIIPLLIGILLIIFGVNGFFSHEKEKIKRAKSEELSSIAALKIGQISEWYADELLDASIIVEGRNLVREIDEWLSDPGSLLSSSEVNEMRATLLQLAFEHGYHSVMVLSSDLSRLISSTLPVVQINDCLLEACRNVVSTRTTSTDGLYLCAEDSNVFIDFVAPVMNSNRVVKAVAIFRHDPNKFLFPLVEKWPVQSRTAETLIVKKEGANVLFLNNLKHIPNSSMVFKLPISESNLPAAKALSGYRGITEGFDYRHQKVIAFVDSIPGTPWYMVAKIDSVELFDNFFFRAASPILIIIISVLLLGMFFYFVYTRQQKNNYKRLYTAQEEFKTTLYSIGDAVITTNMNGIVMVMNPVAEMLTGWDEEEARGKEIEEIFRIVNEETRNSVENPVKKVIEKGAIVGLANHTVLISKQGVEVPISDSGAPIFDQKGDICGVVLVFRDQSEERVYQKSILETQRRLATLMSNLPGMAYRCLNDSDWTMEFVSKGCESLTGYANWELEGNQVISFGNVIFPDDRGYVWEKVEAALDKKEPFQLEYRIQTKQDELLWVWERGQGVFNLAGELEAIEGFITDVTERKNAEIALLESEAIFNQFMEHSPIYVFFKDDNIRSLKLSRNYETMLGKPLDELLGKNMFELFPTEVARKIVDDDIEVLAKGEVITVEESFNGRNFLTIKFPVKIGTETTWLAGYTVDITERKQMEEALRASEEAFQTLAENASVGIFRTTASGLTTYVNPAWCELTGVKSSEAIGEGWIQLVHPDDREHIVESWRNAYAQRIISESEYRFVHPDGKIVWVKGKAVPEFDASGELKGYLGTLSDISDIMNFSETIQRSNTLLRAIIDNIPDAVYMKDVNGKKLIANLADVDNTGAASELELVGKDDFDYYPEDVASKFWDDDLQVLKKGIPVIHREEKLLNLQGHEKWLSTSKIPFRDKNDRIIGLVGIGHDITRQKIIEEEMRTMTKAITQSPVSIVITDPKGTIEYINPKFTEITGYSFEEAVAQSPRLLKSGYQSNEFYENLWQTILSGKDWKGEMQNKKKNGELYWESVIISPILNEDGEIINFVSIKEDITEKKSMMGQLITAKEKAEESDKLKSAFLANMSHEIRTPLNSILGFSNFLTSDDDLSMEEKTEYSDIINKSADSLLQIINDIIDISSLETGQLKTNIRPVNVNPVLRSLYIVFSRKLVEINKSHLILDMVIGDELLVMADENRFIQIFTNLANNAMKFTVRGTIRFGVESHDDTNVVFFVSDTGIGIKSEMHHSIFERFRQVDSDKNRSFGGNGLGLAIVKNLVELMGGYISIESEVDKGSTFRFTLPKA